jgi:hypothetical protein
MIIKQSNATESTRRRTAFQLWLKVSVQILAVGLGLTGMTNSAQACLGSTVINNAVEPSVDSFCDVSIANTGIVSGRPSDPYSIAITYSSSANDTLNNAGVIAANYAGIHIYSTTITTINNTGTISASSIGILNSYSTITTINNTGTISSPIGVYNGGTLTTLNNQQGASGSALTYTGTLASNYNIIISGANVYGQLSATNVTGNMAFNIYGYTGQTLTSGVSASSVINNHLYQNVLTGLVGTLSGSTITGTGFSIAGATGTYGVNNYIYTLLADDDHVSGTWDLLFGSLGPSVADTQSSIRSLASKLRGGFSSQAIATNFANMNTYDCNLFDSKGMCISAGGRYTTVDNPSANSSSAVVVVGYKATPNIRIGGFLDQNVSNNTPNGIKISNKNPLMGIFAVWNQNADGLGVQVKVANAYQDKDVNTTRDVIGTSEAGTGATNLNTQSYVGELSYAFLTNQDKTTLRPYLALRQTTIKQDAYTETGVATPLTYSTLKDRSTTALVGLKLNHAVTPKATLTASFGIEQDLEHSVDQYSATSSSIANLTSENFNDSIKRTRPVASAGAYYAVSKTQRISGDVYYQQLPFQSTGSTTAYFSYMIGL